MKILLYILAYFVIGIIMSIIHACYEFKSSWRNDLDDYINHDLEDDLPFILLTIVIWPIMAFVIGIMLIYVAVLKYVFKEEQNG